MIACNSKIDLSFTEFLKGENVRHIGYVIEAGKLLPQEVPNKFVEVIIAPEYDPDAFELLTQTKSLRLLKVRPFGQDRRWDAIWTLWKNSNR